MKIHIIYQLRSDPTGGGNQFLKAVKDQLKKEGLYTDDPDKADVFLFNSHQFVLDVARMKMEYPDRIFVHRIDGPIKLYNRKNDRRDNIIYMANKLIADGTLFQSHWSKKANYGQRLNKKSLSGVIHNAPDDSIFNTKGKLRFSKNRRVRLIASSWSHNWNKGFDIYQWMDKHLDHKKYEMTFMGNSPVKFRNTRHIKPLPSRKVALELKRNDIFISGSRIEACCNSILEALHCGLPTIAPRKSSNPEIVGKAGECFNRPEEIPGLLEKIISHYKEYQSGMDLPLLKETAMNYYQFMLKLDKLKQTGRLSVKKISKLDLARINAQIYFWKAQEKFNRIISN